MANETADEGTRIYKCPKTNGKYTLTQIVAKLNAEKDFAEFFARQLKDANGGDLAAIACVDSYFEPTNQELQDLGIPESRIGPMRRCTDSGLLFLVIAKDNAHKVCP